MTNHRTKFLNYSEVYKEMVDLHKINIGINTKYINKSHSNAELLLAIKQDVKVNDSVIQN